MKIRSKIARSGARAASAVLLATSALMMPAVSVNAAPGVMSPDGPLVLSVGRGQVVNLPSKMSDVVVANPLVVDVHVRSETQLYILAKAPGESNVFVTSSNGKVLYSSTVRVGNNLTSIDQMLGLAMPDAEIQVSTMNGMVLLTGTIKAPEDAAEAERLVQAFVGKETTVVSRLRTATPLQVNLHVKIAEVSKSLMKSIGGNTAIRDITNGGTLYQFGRNPGRVNFSDLTAQNPGSYPVVDCSAFYGLPTGSLNLPFNPATGQCLFGGALAKFTNPAEGNIASVVGKLFGVNFATALDLAETNGLLATLAEPNLTALSGETASFLAGGEFPIPLSSTLGQITIEYKKYGVSLSFTPTVLADGRISMRVRPEVSELSQEGAVVLNNLRIPAVTTRQLETTVELGSGQSFMIGGLMRNTSQNNIEGTPGLSNVPILGNMFKSTGWQKNQTELVIIVTPYLVRPVDDNQIKLPTDGFLNATDAERVLLNQTNGGRNGEAGERPTPTMAPPVTVPANGAPATSAPAASAAPTTGDAKGRRARRDASAAAPGFSF